MRWDDGFNNLSYVDCVFMVNQNKADTMGEIDGSGSALCLASGRVRLNTRRYEWDDPAFLQ
jgi:hypothetical protein